MKIVIDDYERIYIEADEILYELVKENIDLRLIELGLISK